ncbi:MAG: glycosyltransferase family 4 protein [Bryobacteraceae bacterium]
MRFSLDAHAIGRNLTGNEVYARNLLHGFAALDRESEFIAYVSVAEAARWIPERFLTRRVSPNPFCRLGFDLSRKLRRDRPALVHVQYTAPAACPVPVVVSVHDVSFLEHPEFFSAGRAAQLRWTVRRTVKRAARVLTGSDFSRASILRMYPDLDPERVEVVPNAASPAFRPISRETAAATVKERFGVAAPFVLTVGDLQPRKNHAGLIAAFARMVRAYPRLPHHLVLAGKDTWHAPRVREAARQSGIASRIRFTGFVSDDDLLHLYNACDVFVFPSYYEGFGLPVLEAMACQRAVACSGTSALPEVADGAALLFDPYAPDDVAKALADLLRDSELRARMERLGGSRAAQFSWNKTAGRTLGIYYEVAQGVLAGKCAGTAHIARS